MNIRDYLNTEKPKKDLLARVAAQVGASPYTVRSWGLGSRRPARRYWEAIEKATHGLVSKLDLVE